MGIQGPEAREDSIRPELNAAVCERSADKEAPCQKLNRTPAMMVRGTPGWTMFSLMEVA